MQLLNPAPTPVPEAAPAAASDPSTYRREPRKPSDPAVFEFMRRDLKVGKRGRRAESTQAEAGGG
jgi:hypothetical protein